MHKRRGWHLTASLCSSEIWLPVCGWGDHILEQTPCTGSVHHGGTLRLLPQPHTPDLPSVSFAAKDQWVFMQIAGIRPRGICEGAEDIMIGQLKLADHATILVKLEVHLPIRLQVRKGHPGSIEHVLLFA